MKKEIFYYPMDLNQENASDLFLGSISRKNSKYLVQAIIFPKESGFPEDSKPIYFDASQVSLNKYTIAYMLGQLRDVHEGKQITSTKSILYNYKNEEWISDKSVLISFLHLAQAADLIGVVNASDLSIKLSPIIEPTFGKETANYKDGWYKAYREKMNQKIIEQESVEIQIVR